MKINSSHKNNGEKMLEADINISIPFQSLVSSVRQLTFEEKLALLETIEEQLEEQLMQKNPLVQQEIEAARAAYEAGDYVTLDDYKARNKERLL
ncbi:MAG: hypothetical protein MUC94_18255 [bacterium]|jgi:hypothetical protein|nr:hypothetical protein [bacterium]